MTKKTEAAKKTMASGYNCAQSVLTTFAPDMELSRHDALRVAGPFGAGMGLMGNVCGAVTGAFMAIGLRYAKTNDDENDAKHKGYQLVQEFSKKFTEKHGTIQCKELIGLDLNTEEGYATAVDSGIFKTECIQYVEDATAILEELLGEV
ncbi:MAG: C_GCAxxG_C_C family protein [Deltaproteobacteria bacterium]|nr:C_GCAxxG_C_C family protein [Deltaproteobacteria bacterium]